MRTARSKGLTERQVVAHHVVRNAIGPALSMAGLQLGFMFAGVVVVEQVFSWPGIGNYLAASIPVSDFPAIAGVTLVLGAIYVLSNVVVDLLQALADPRVPPNEAPPQHLFVRATRPPNKGVSLCTPDCCAASPSAPR